ncbi:MAG: hypothetical protein HRU14_03160 [Planctomycetes bacterium]|nr:hypothetical protein [Planctomycetota bacterium]
MSADSQAWTDLAVGPDACLRATHLEDGVVRLQYHLGDEQGTDRSHAVVARRPVDGPPPVRMDGDVVVITDAGGTTIAEIPSSGLSSSGQRRDMAFVYPHGERTFGFGEKAGKLDHRGRVLRFWNTDSFMYDRLTDPVYKSIPFWIGVRDGRAYGVLIDNPGRISVDCGAWEQDRLRVRTETGALDLYVVPGPDPLDVVRRYTALTGRPALPPRWALGLHQCRYSYHPAARVNEVARGFREHDIPCDAVWLDIHYMHGYRCFTWDPDGFPDPQAFINSLHDDGFKVVVMIDPGLKVEDTYHAYAKGREADAFVKMPDGSEGHGTCWPGPCAYPDFFSPATRVWWGELYRTLVEAGVDGYWNDMNEPAVFDGPGGTFPDDTVHQTEDGPVAHAEVHNAYGHEMVRATRDGIAAMRPGKRPFVLTRAAYAGTQRYAAAWSGDNFSSWDDLKHAIPMALNMSASGFPLYGPDVGGFAGAPSPELFVRWLQAAAHLGLMRVHTCLGSPDQEPWSFGEPWTSCAREAIRTRYRLLAYIYAMVHDAARNGTPMIRPLWMEWPHIPHLAEREDCWMLGYGLLVAPVLEPGVTRLNVSLPPGRWHTFPDGRPLRTDGCEATVDAPMDRIPVLARGGAIVPWLEPGRNSDDTGSDVLRVKLFAGGHGNFTLVEDANDGPPDGGGPRRDIAVNLHSESLHHIVTVEAPVGEHVGTVRALDLELHGLPGPPDQVMRDGVPAAARSHPATRDDPDGWAWDTEVCSVRMIVPVDALPVRIEFSHPPLPTAESRPALVARATDDPDAPWPEGGGVHLAGGDHVVQSSWWAARDVEAMVQARWTPQVLQVRCVVADADRAQTENDQEDGIRLVLEVPDGVVHVRIGPDGRSWVREDLYWAPHGRIVADVRADAGGTVYRFDVPAAVLGPPELDTGLTCGCDLAVQHSDRDGSRAIVEWVRGYSAPERPGGVLKLV